MNNLEALKILGGNPTDDLRTLKGLSRKGNFMEQKIDEDINVEESDAIFGVMDDSDDSTQTPEQLEFEKSILVIEKINAKCPKCGFFTATPHFGECPKV